MRLVDLLGRRVPPGADDLTDEEKEMRLVDLLGRRVPPGADDLTDEEKKKLESLLAEVNRRAQRPKQPSEENKSEESRPVSPQRQPSKTTRREDIRRGPHNPYYGKPFEKQIVQNRPAPHKRRPSGRRRSKRGVSSWLIAGGIMVVLIFVVARIIITDRPNPGDSPRELDTVARIVKDEAPRPDPGFSTGTLATPAPQPTEPVPPPVAISETDELRIYALDLINKDRNRKGLPPVVLGTNPAAQMHAEDMLSNEYQGHWWTDGRKPYMVYTETGGTSYGHENVASSGWTSREWTAKGCGSSRVVCDVPTASEAIYKLQRLMVYDDSHADWGHRDNILGETHRAVNIGVASNGRRVTFVQHFEGGDVVASTRPVLSTDGRLSFSVSKVADGIEIAPLVSIYLDPPPTPKTREQIERLHSYCVGGGFTEGCGEPVVEVLEPPPPGSFYTSLQGNEVVANEWTETPRAFSFSASLGNLTSAPGVYTVVIWRDSPDLFTEVLVELSVTKP